MTSVTVRDLEMWLVVVKKKNDKFFLRRLIGI